MNMKLCYTLMDQQSITNSVENSTGQTWSIRSKWFAKLAICQTAKVRRQQLSAAFEQADKEELPPFNINDYGHTHGDILATLDLFQENLLFGFFLIGRWFHLLFVNNEAKQFVDDVIYSVMNRYHGINHITTEGIALDLT